MKNNLENRKVEVELMRVQTARAEIELKILEREDEIQRLRDHIEVQLKKENELKEKINNVKEGN